MCYCRSIEQGLHIDQVAQRMVGYSRQQVKWVFISLSFASHLCLSLICPEVTALTCILES
jgi:hypothetical protein